MKTSQVGLSLVAEFEGFRAEPYPDIGGKLSIGFGHLIKPTESFTSLTYAQAQALLSQDMEPVDNALTSLVQVPVTQNQWDALASLTYNIGSGNFMHSTLLRRLNGGDKAGAAQQFLVWVCLDGHPVDGLRRRRAAERQLFETA